MGNKSRALEKIMEENDLAEKRGFRIENCMAEQKGQANQNDGITRDLAKIPRGRTIDHRNAFLVGQTYIASIEYCQVKRKRCFRCWIWTPGMVVPRGCAM